MLEAPESELVLGGGDDESGCVLILLAARLLLVGLHCAWKDAWRHA